MQNSSQQQNLQQQIEQIVTPASILDELKRIYQQVLEQEKRQLNQLLNLEKVLNYVQTTSGFVKNNDQQKNKKDHKQEKKQFDIQKLGQKIDDLIEQTQEVNVLEKLQENKKIPSLTAIKPKKQSKSTKPQPVIEKKPPLPGINRSNDPSSRTSNFAKYVPPRDKNNVTGKVTQTKITTQQKVFKPEITSKVGQSASKVTTKTNLHLSSSVQKRASTNSSTSTNTAATLATKQPINSPPISHSLEPDTNSISDYKNLRANTKVNKFHQFSKPIEQIIEEMMNKKQTQKKKFNFTQALQKYQNQEMGHKTIQEKRRKQFIKKFNNFALSINSAHLHQITHSAPKRLWKQYSQIFEFNNLIQGFQSDIMKIKELVDNDCRVDPKQAFRLQVKRAILAQQIQKIKQSTQIEVPEKLQLTMKPILQGKNKKKLDSSEQQVDYGSLYSKFHSLLSQIQQQQTLSTKDLSSLRVLASISLYNGKKSPLIVQSSQFESWKQFYQQVDDVQTNN